MGRRNPFTLLYAPQFKRHLDSIEPKYYSLIQEIIEEQLRFEPLRETRNRKPLLRPVFDADWELRFGPNNRFRVFYAAKDQTAEVRVVAIGVKDRNRLIVGGEEIQL